MQRLGDRVLNHDTDSIIYSVKEGEYNPPLGSYLGELTDELSCKELGYSKENCTGHWIEEFVSCGPKNYSFRVDTGYITVKTELCRSKNERTVFNRVIAKHYGVVYDKRIVKSDFTTVPFGYRK